MTDIPPTSLVARNPEDLLAMVPIVIGFAPSDSVVMLTFEAEHCFHARVDLPARADEVDDLVAGAARPGRAATASAGWSSSSTPTITCG